MLVFVACSLTCDLLQRRSLSLHGVLDQGTRPEQICCRLHGTYGWLLHLASFVQFAIIMRCANGILAKGIWGITGFSLLRWEKGLRPPLPWGKGSETPSFPAGRSMRNEGVSDPFSHCKRESQTLFPTAKGETSYIPRSP